MGNFFQKNHAIRLFFSNVALGFVVFGLSIFLVRSRQHTIKYGYLVSDLEQKCFAHNQKISELDGAILSMVSRNKITENIEKNVWKVESKIVRVSKIDVQSYALAKNSRTGIAIAKNFSGTN
jgi:fructose-1,6-bisphosphatase